MERTARLSDCGHYRYALGRRWGAGARAVFVMLNPSTADAERDDPTIRRCIGFAARWGFGALTVVNLYSWRATRPADLRRARDPVGPGGDEAIERATLGAALVVAAWGAHGDWRGRGAQVASRLSDPHALGLTRSGAPRHPLYVRKDARPQPWGMP